MEVGNDDLSFESEELNSSRTTITNENGTCATASDCSSSSASAGSVDNDGSSSSESAGSVDNDGSSSSTSAGTVDNDGSSSSASAVDNDGSSSSASAGAVGNDSSSASSSGEAYGRSPAGARANSSKNSSSVDHAHASTSFVPSNFSERCEQAAGSGKKRLNANRNSDKRLRRNDSNNSSSIANTPRRRTINRSRARSRCFDEPSRERRSRSQARLTSPTDIPVGDPSDVDTGENLDTDEFSHRVLASAYRILDNPVSQVTPSCSSRQNQVSDNYSQISQIMSKPLPVNLSPYAIEISKVSNSGVDSERDMQPPHLPSSNNNSETGTINSRQDTGEGLRDDGASAAEHHDLSDDANPHLDSTQSRPSSASASAGGSGNIALSLTSRTEEHIPTETSTGWASSSMGRFRNFFSSLTGSSIAPNVNFESSLGTVSSTSSASPANIDDSSENKSTIKKVSPKQSKLTKDKSHQNNSPDSSDSSGSQENCSICLSGIKDACVAGSCLHRFCFVCLREWSTRKAVCPLCKRPFKVIMHDIKGDQDYKEYVVPVSTAAPMNFTRRFLDNPFLRNMNFPDFSHVHHEYVLPNDEHLLVRPRARRFGGDHLSYAYMLQRRRIYDDDLWVRYTTPTGTHRDTYPALFAEQPALTHRLMLWLTRELDALRAPQSLNDRISTAITMMAITSRRFSRIVRPVLGHKTDHFIHEFYCYARSGYDLAGYDNATYDAYGSYSTRISPPAELEMEDLEDNNRNAPEIDLTDDSREQAAALSEENAAVIAGPSASATVVKEESTAVSELVSSSTSSSASAEGNDHLADVIRDHQYHASVIHLNRVQSHLHQLFPSCQLDCTARVNIDLTDDSNNISLELPANTQMTLTTRSSAWNSRPNFLDNFQNRLQNLEFRRSKRGRSSTNARLDRPYRPTRPIPFRPVVDNAESRDEENTVLLSDDVDEEDDIPMNQPSTSHTLDTDEICIVHEKKSRDMNKKQKTDFTSIVLSSDSSEDDSKLNMKFQAVTVQNNKTMGTDVPLKNRLQLQRNNMVILDESTSILDESASALLQAADDQRDSQTSMNDNDSIGREPKDHPSRIKSSSRIKQKPHHGDQIRKTMRQIPSCSLSSPLSVSSKEGSVKRESEQNWKVTNVRGACDILSSDESISYRTAVRTTAGINQKRRSLSRVGGAVSISPASSISKQKLLPSQRNSKDSVNYTSNCARIAENEVHTDTPVDDIYSSDEQEVGSRTPSLFINIARAARPILSDSDDDGNVKPIYSHSKSSTFSQGAISKNKNGSSKCKSRVSSSTAAEPSSSGQWSITNLLNSSSKRKMQSVRFPSKTTRVVTYGSSTSSLEESDYFKDNAGSRKDRKRIKISVSSTSVRNRRYAEDASSDSSSTESEYSDDQKRRGSRKRSSRKRSPESSRHHKALEKKKKKSKSSHKSRHHQGKSKSSNTKKISYD